MFGVFLDLPLWVRLSSYTCSIEQAFDRLPPKLSVVVDRHLFMNTTTGTIEEVSLMSTIAAARGFGTRRPAATRRVAHRPAAAPVDVRLTRRGRLVLLVLFSAW